MHHIGTITTTDQSRPFHAQCSCGPAGDFATKDAALGFLHFHFSKLTGVNTYEVREGVEAVKPSAHIGGLGTMPVSHAPAQTPAGPPPPPPPPDTPKGTE